MSFRCWLDGLFCFFVAAMSIGENHIPHDSYRAFPKCHSPELPFLHSFTLEELAVVVIGFAAVFSGAPLGLRVLRPIFCMKLPSTKFSYGANSYIRVRLP